MDMKEENIQLKIKLLNNEISEYNKEKLRFNKILKSIPSKLEFNTYLVIELEMRSIKTKKESITRYFYFIKEPFEKTPEILIDIEHITFAKSERNLRNDIAKKTHIEHCKEQINRMNKLDKIISTKYEQCIQEIGFAQREIEGLREELKNFGETENEEIGTKNSQENNGRKNKGIMKKLRKIIKDDKLRESDKSMDEIRSKVTKKLTKMGFQIDDDYVHRLLNGEGLNDKNKKNYYD